MAPADGSIPNGQAPSQGLADAFGDALSASSEKKDSAIGADLSAGYVPPKVLSEDSLGLTEQRHRHGLQQSIFSCAITVAVVLYISAIVFAGFVLLKSAPGQLGADWHSSLLAGAFIVPPTVMMIVLIRAVYASANSKEASADDLPSISLVKEILAIVKDAAGTGK